MANCSGYAGMFLFLETIAIFVKKTQKTPKKEIRKAEDKMKEYFENKKNG